MLLINLQYTDRPLKAKNYPSNVNSAKAEKLQSRIKHLNKD